MGCPCANPPGKGGKRPVPRNPITMKPINPNTRLSRQDIRLGRTRKEAIPLNDDPEEDDGDKEDGQAKNDNVPRTNRFRIYRPRPMGGFTTDPMRKR